MRPMNTVYIREEMGVGNCVAGLCTKRRAVFQGETDAGRHARGWRWRPASSPRWWVPRALRPFGPPSKMAAPASASRWACAASLPQLADRNCGFKFSDQTRGSWWWAGAGRCRRCVAFVSVELWALHRTHRFFRAHTTVCHWPALCPPAKWQQAVVVARSSAWRPEQANQVGLGCCPCTHSRRIPHCPHGTCLLGCSSPRAASQWSCQKPPAASSPQ